MPLWFSCRSEGKITMNEDNVNQILDMLDEGIEFLKHYNHQPGITDIQYLLRTASVMLAKEISREGEIKP